MSRTDSDTAHPPGDDHKPVRIAKAIARAGLCSRRDAEDWIAAGRVAVNGEIIATPAVTVTARDRVTIDGAPLPQRERTRLFLYYKPVGLVTTTADPEGRPTIFSALPNNLPRLVSVGRLDIATEGLLLLTNDGGLARVLELPATGWVRRYRVRAHGRVDQASLDRLRDGITIDGIHYGPIEATLDRDLGTNVWLTVAIREGKNREVRKVVEALGLQANRLIRVSFGPFQLGEMSEGEVSEVKTRVLRDQLGERVIAEADCDFSAPVVTRDAAAREPSRTEREPTHRRAEKSSPEKRTERAPRTRRDERPQRGDDRPMRGRDEGDRRVGPRDGRPPRRERDEGLQPLGRQGTRFRRPRREDQDMAPLGRPRRGNAWRSDDAPLGRHYRGAGSKARRLPEETERPKRAGLIADRKGRRVLVERFGEKPATPRPVRENGGAASPRRSSSTSPLEGKVGAKRREGGKFKPRAATDTRRPDPSPQGGGERFRSDQRPRGKPFRPASEVRDNASLPKGERFRNDRPSPSKPPRRDDKSDRYGSKSERFGSKPHRRGNETDQRGGRAERWEDKAPRRYGSRTPRPEGEVGSQSDPGGGYKRKASRERTDPFGTGAKRWEERKTRTPESRNRKGPDSRPPRGDGPRPPRPPRSRSGAPHAERASSSRSGGPRPSHRPPRTDPKGPRGGGKPTRPGPKSRR